MSPSGSGLPARRLKVRYVLDGYTDPNAGTEIQFWLLLQNLDRTRFEPSVLLLRESPFLRENLGDIPLEVLNVTRLKSPAALWRILRSVLTARRAGVDVAHLYFNDVSLVFPRLLRLVGLPCIVSRRDLGFWYSPANLKLLRLNAGAVNAVVANCKAVERAVIEAEGFRQDQVRVIYNGIARQEAAADPAVRARFAIPAAAKLVVLVANLRPLKRIQDAVQAVALVAKRVPDVHLAVVGEDREGATTTSYRGELESLARSLGIHERVHFVGKQRDPMPLVQAADVCVLCSETEGLSNTVIEYMLAGKPAVCTDVGGNGELVEEGRTGYLVPVADAAMLGARIGELLEDHARAAAFGAAARARANELFAPQTMLRMHEALYTSLARPVENTEKPSTYRAL
jgi:L-malate glycosyltransferase